MRLVVLECFSTVSTLVCCLQALYLRLVSFCLSSSRLMVVIYLINYEVTILCTRNTDPKDKDSSDFVYLRILFTYI